MPEGLKERKEKIDWREKVRRNQLTERFIIGFVMILTLGFFLHFREVRIEILEVGTNSKGYVFAQIDFEFPDQETTTMLRKEALRDASLVYALDDNEIKNRRLDFENMLIHKQEWRREVQSSTFEEMYKAAEAMQEQLSISRFTDPRTIKKMKEMGMDTTSVFVLPGSTNESLSLPSPFWASVRTNLLQGGKFHPATIDYTMSYFRRFRWQLENDVSYQTAIKDAVEKSVAERFTKVRSGTRIVDQGEKVTARHVAMLQAMKSALDEKRNLWQPLTILGSILFSVLIVVIGTYFLRFNQKAILNSLPKLSLYVTIIILTLFIAKGTEFFLLRNPGGLVDFVKYPIFVPFAAILIAILLGSEAALFTTCFLSVIFGVTLAFDHSKITVINLVLGVVSILLCRGVRKRKEVFVVCIKVWLISIPIIFAYNLMANYFWSMSTLSDFISTLCFMGITAILVVGLLPIFESLFHVMTDITLMEYMDPSNELLRRLTLEAPGTYQHSLVVGSLSEAAAQAIGANSLFCRVASLYHDIGKLFNPHYFTENQMGGFNIHQLLTPVESAQVIIAHVPEGEMLARKYGLPQGFIDIIKEHHGTTLVYYFYAKQVGLMGGDVSAVDESMFRYHGPTPHSKESAIIMIADTVEAASRSLEDPSEESIAEMVERLIADKDDEGQFDHCELTFEEFGIVKRAMVKTLAVTRHLRIKYPEKKRMLT